MPSSTNLLSLPVECLTLILGCIEEQRTQTLHSLLTVCKALFEISVRQLYYDPIRSFLDLSSHWRSETSLVERFSPSTKIPYVDYLFFVRVFRISGARDRSSFARTYAKILSSVWGVCSHPLSNLHAISIPCWSLETWAGSVPAMVHLATIEFVVDLPMGRTDLGVVEQIQNAVEFTKKLLEARATAGVHSRLDVQLSEVGLHHDFYGKSLWPSTHDWKKPARALYELGATAQVYSLDDLNSPDAVRFFASPSERMDFSRLHTFRQHSWMCKWKLDGSVHRSDLFKYCPSLRSMHLLVEEDDASFFKWAAEKQRQFPPAHGFGNLQQPFYGAAPLPPLQHLGLTVRNQQAADVTADILEYIIVPFGPTLRTLHVVIAIWPDSKPWKIPSMHGLQRLSEFRARGLILYGPSTFTQLPRLTVLDLHDAIETDVSPMDPWILPKSLTTLRLRAAAALRFPQSTFASVADHLEHIEFVEVENLVWSRLECGFSWDVSQWVFPSLRSIKLSGVFAREFRISMLIHCPVIESIELHTVRIIPRILPELSDCLFPLTTTAEREEHSVGIHSKISFGLRSLTVTRFQVEDDVLATVIPSLFPQLTDLTMHGCWMWSIWSDARIRELYPSVRHISWKGNKQVYNLPLKK